MLLLRIYKWNLKSSSRKDCLTNTVIFIRQAVIPECNGALECAAEREAEEKSGASVAGGGGGTSCCSELSDEEPL